MTTWTLTKATGGTVQPTGVLDITPGQQVVDASAATAVAETELNGRFITDPLSACLAHKRCGPICTAPSPPALAILAKPSRG